MNGHDHPELFEPTAEEVEQMETEDARADWLIGMVDDGTLPDDLRAEAIAVLLETDWEDSDAGGQRGELLAHPDCRKCHGTGYYTSCDWHPYGDTYVPEYMSETCSCVWRER